MFYRKCWDKFVMALANVLMFGVEKPLIYAAALYGVNALFHFIQDYLLYQVASLWTLKHKRDFPALLPETF